MMKRILPILLLLFFCAIPVVQATKVTYTPQVEHLDLKVGEEYSFVVNLKNTEAYPLTAIFDNEIENFAVDCCSTHELAPGERASIEITLRPLGPVGKFERIIDVTFETDRAKAWSIGVKIKGVVRGEESVPTGAPDLIHVLITVLAVIVALVIGLLKRLRG